MIGFILAAIFLAGAMAGAWAIRLRSGQSGWVDAIWSAAVGMGGAMLALYPFGDITPRQWLCATLVALWSARLASHIARRTASAKGDDPRYAALRREWGDAFPRRLFLFLQIQALCAFGLAVSVWAAAHAPRPGLDRQDGLGIMILLLAIGGEGIADAQLRRFAAANPGKVADRGLWAWSRHPNYFFEWIGWFGYVAIAITPGYGPGWLTLIGPILLYWLLVHASGIPPLEAHMLRSRGDAFRAYQRRVSAFFPWPPKASGDNG